MGEFRVTINPKNKNSITQSKTMSSTVLPMNKLITVKTSPTIRVTESGVPQFERSLSVLYPINAKIPNIAAVAAKA